MKILSVTLLAIPDVKVIRFARFLDHRGYFTEPYRKSQFKDILDVDFLQCNESFSYPNTVRGLHFQWNPFMGKLVRTVYGRMCDIVVDIRKGSPTFGKGLIYDMPADPADFNEWIWVPPGFAHGNFFTRSTLITYFCSGEHSPECEAGISPFSPDIDWSLADTDLKQEFDKLGQELAFDGDPRISTKDRYAPNLTEWSKDEHSNNFIYGQNL